MSPQIVTILLPSFPFLLCSLFRQTCFRFIVLDIHLISSIQILRPFAQCLEPKQYLYPAFNLSVLSVKTIPASSIIAMPYFASLRQSLANFIAPAPNVSDQPLPVSSAGSRDIKPRLDRGRISSTNHTKEWLKTPTQERDTKRSNILGAKNSKVVKSTSIQRSSRTPSTTMKASDKPWSMQLLFSILSKKSSALAEDQLEGSTLVQTPLAAQSTHNNAAPNTTLKLVGNASTVIGDDDEGPKELPQNEFKGWTPDEIWLFEKLNMRGFEPLLDWTWALDFPTLIEELFSLDDSKVFIRSVSGNDYYGNLLEYSPSRPLQ